MLYQHEHSSRYAQAILAILNYDEFATFFCFRYVHPVQGRLTRSDGALKQAFQATAPESMMRQAEAPKSSSVATAMRYRDVAAAVDWLCAAFAFEKQVVTANESGVIVYAQLTFGNALIMLGPVHDTRLDNYMKQPDEIGGAETQSCYFVVGDIDAHFVRAKAAGAQIILDMEVDRLGGQGYSCRDHEGHIWNFGTYDPWRRASLGAHQPQPVRGGSRRARRWTALAGLGAAIGVSAAAIGWNGRTPWQSDTSNSVVREARDRLSPESIASLVEERAARMAQQHLDQARSTIESAERAGRELQVLIDRERAARMTADLANENAQKLVATERNAREAAERAVREAREQSKREKAEMVIPERANDEAQKQMALERSAREVAERAHEQARQRLAQEYNSRIAAERALEQAMQRLAEAQGARQAAERAERETREQLDREQRSKAAALRAATQLRKQLSRALSTKEPGEAPAGN